MAKSYGVFTVNVDKRRLPSVLRQWSRDSTVLSQYASIIAKYADDYIPLDTGKLQKSKRVGPGQISYTMPYAHYQYEGWVYVDPKTNKGAFVGRDYNGNKFFWSRPGVRKRKAIRFLHHKGGRVSNWVKYAHKKHNQDIKDELKKNLHTYILEKTGGAIKL